MQSGLISWEHSFQGSVQSYKSHILPPPDRQIPADEPTAGASGHLLVQLGATDSPSLSPWSAVVTGVVKGPGATYRSH